MRLKEAFTLQNKIQTLYRAVIDMLVSETFVDTKIVHIYSKANIGNDVTETLPKPVSRLAGDKPYDFDRLVDFAQNVLSPYSVAETAFTAEPSKLELTNHPINV